MAKPELLATIRDRYRASCKREKSRILDEFIAELTSSGNRHHRKHGIRLLGQSINDWEQQPAVKRADAATTRRFARHWSNTDHGKRLVPLPGRFVTI